MSFQAQTGVRIFLERSRGGIISLISFSTSTLCQLRRGRLFLFWYKLFSMMPKKSIGTCKLASELFHIVVFLEKSYHHVVGLSLGWNINNATP